MTATVPQDAPATDPARPVELPLWLQEIDASLPVAAQFVVTGNVHDIHLMPVLDGPDRTTRPPGRLGTVDALWQSLAASGYVCMVVYDPVDGPRVHPATAAATATVRGILGCALPEELSLPRLGEHIRTLVTASSHRVAFALDYASRLIQDSQHLTPEEYAFLAAMHKLSLTAEPHFVTGTRPIPLYNAVFWLADTVRDLPAWFTADNDALRTVAVPKPDLGDRVRLAEMLVPSLPGAAEHAHDAPAIARTFAEHAQDMTLRAMMEITRLAIDRRIPATEVEDAVRCYRVGMLENPWKKTYLRERIKAGEALLTGQVRGQDRAIRVALDILIRSTVGLTGAHSSGQVTRPRGILFFAGPTGVGKTELAKAITELVFGDASAYSRFDMSEFSAEHSEARLIGAPPGYVGHGTGGELTNAVRNQPFSLLLFDEVEKAHPRVLDKFLQVLEDGRLTDGMGATVHFSETLLVFTSNLGIYVDDENGDRVLNVEPGTDRDEMEKRVKDAISHHFTHRLNRPELLNRIGRNIVIFDFISPEVAAELVAKYLDNITQRVLRELGVVLTVTPPVRAELARLATDDLSFGGRGIGSVLEAVFVNPLARALFTAEAAPGTTVQVTGLVATELGWEVRLG